MMHDQMMGGGMMWGMGLTWLLLIVVLALAIAALVKHLRSRWRKVCVYGDPKTDCPEQSE